MRRVAIAIACTLAAPAAAKPQLPREANDDLEHVRQRLAPILAGARDCIPSVTEDTLLMSLDSYDGKLVACAQVLTRRSVSVNYDLVSYACWNLEPATGKLARRGDLGRSYFRCQDGKCAPGETNRTVSYDGRSRLVFDDAKHLVTIASRDGKSSRSFRAPNELAGAELFAGELVLLGTTWFAHGDNATIAFDDSGKLLARLPFGELRALDATHVLIIPVDNPMTSTIYDVAARATRTVTLPGAFAATAVRHRGALYAMDEHRFVALDPETFVERSRVPLKVCP
jgi:hypothetical protein